jgi:hypothetical protein
MASSATWFLNKKSSRGILLPFLFLEQKKNQEQANAYALSRFI